MSKTPKLADVVGLLEGRADPGTAEEWDRIGLVTGDPDQPVRSVLFAVDPLPAVVEEAVSVEVDLLVTHHPLLLRGVHSVATTSAAGRSVHDLIRAGCALFTMHTNADSAVGGVNDALSDAVGMSASRRPIRPIPDIEMARVVVYVPAEHSDAVVAALSTAGAGRLGDYDFCAYWVDGTGQFRPLSGANPHIGSVGVLERVAERRIEMVFPKGRVAEIESALRIAHPYEEPAFSMVASEDLPGARGIGRVGAVEPISLAALARRLAVALPRNAHGVRVAGDPDLEVATVAVCGGAGDSLLADVRSLAADAYITSDLRHHPASDFIAEGGGALMDISHAAGESLWLERWAAQLESDAEVASWSLRASVTQLNTDPWTFRVETDVGSL